MAGVAAAATDKYNDTVESVKQKIAEQQEDPDSVLNQAKEKASGVADKVKETTGNIVDKAGDLLDNLAAQSPRPRR